MVAVAEYDDPALRELRAPSDDAIAMRDLLQDPRIGGFTVTSVIDGRAQQIRLAVEEFLSDRSTEDVLLVYLSCHGLVDLRRRLYFAARDTVKNRLAASGVESHWLLDQLEDCRARRQVVILDCCFSGAFAQGTKGDTELNLGERLVGSGRGRVVLTASRATEYSFEGEPVPGEVAEGSVFTGALVDGIRTGAADTDADGYITVDDAYAFAFERVRASGAQQTPQRWLYGAEGSIVLARNPVVRSTGPPPEKPPDPPRVAAGAAPGPGAATTPAPVRRGRGRGRCGRRRRRDGRAAEPHPRRRQRQRHTAAARRARHAVHREDHRDGPLADDRARRHQRPGRPRRLHGHAHEREEQPHRDRRDLRHASTPGARGR